MIDDLLIGKRNKRGDWSPNEPIRPSPMLDFPIDLEKILKWIPSYFYPYNLLWLLTAWLFYTYLTPDVETLKGLRWDWPALLLLRNVIAALAFYSVYELRLYILRSQGARFKYNSKFPSESKNPAFLFGSQNIDSFIRMFGTGIPIWTAFEVLVLWCSANGYGPWISFSEHPLYLVAVYLLLPIVHEIHFFAIHRLIHTPLLYKWVHSVHHNSVNPSPFSSLSMHPVEHLLYFSTVLYQFVLPSHPVLAITQLHMAGFGAVIGHIGFDKIEVGGDFGVDTHSFAHYLHHKYFEVNYADGLIPLDKWLGTWHDGTSESEARMNVRYQRRKEKLNAQARATNERRST